MMMVMVRYALSIKDDDNVNSLQQLYLWICGMRRLRCDHPSPLQVWQVLLFYNCLFDDQSFPLTSDMTLMTIMSLLTMMSMLKMESMLTMLSML